MTTQTIPPPQQQQQQQRGGGGGGGTPKEEEEALLGETPTTTTLTTTQRRQQRTLVIKSFKTAPKIPPRFLDRAWSERLRVALRAIHDQEPCEESHERIYRLVEDLVVGNFGTELYEKVKRAVEDRYANGGGVSFCTYVVIEWWCNINRKKQQQCDDHIQNA